MDLLLQSSTALTITGATSGEAQPVTFILRQDSTGGRAITWPSGTRWPGATAPVIPTAANSRSIVTLLSINGGASWDALLAGPLMG